MIRIFPLIFLLVGSMVCPAQQKNSDIPANMRQFGDPLIKALYLNYLTEPNTVSKKPATTYEALPEVLKTLVDQAQLEPLDTLMNAAANVLSQPVRQLELFILFLPPDSAQIEKEKIYSLLDQAEVNIKVVDQAIRDINTFLDWYTGDDWQQRFGDTGFFASAQQLKQKADLAGCRISYYRAMVNFDRSNQTEDLLTDLSNSWATLEKNIQTYNQNPTGPAVPMAIYRLWQARLARALALYQKSYLDQARQALQLLLESSTSADVICETRLESLRFAAQAYPDNFSLIRDETDNLRNWIEENQNNLSKEHLRWLELEILQASLATRKDQHPLAGLKQLIRRYPELEATVNYLIGGYHAAAFTIASDSVPLIGGWDDIDYLSLCRYYQAQQPPQRQHAIKAYKTFLLSRPTSNKHYPQVLYEIGLCHLQQVEQKEFSKAESVVFHEMAALNYWNDLARNFPEWTWPHDPDNLNASHIASQVAAMAYKLFVHDPETYTDTALKVMPTLIGNFDPTSVTFSGPFAQSVSAGKYRYYYALVLQSARQFPTAAALFTTVPVNDVNKDNAKYNSLYCRFQQVQKVEQSPEKQALIQQDLADQLRLYIEQNPKSIYISEARILLTQLYLQLDQVESALQLIRKDLFDQLDDPFLRGLTLNLLQKQRPVLLQFHAREQKQNLLSALNESLPVSNKVAKATAPILQDTLQGQALLAVRIFIEQLCLAAVTEAHSPVNLAPKESLCRQAEEWLDQLDNIPELKQQLWMVRCHALLDYAAGRYVSSQQLWYQVRQATDDREKTNNQYYWWEARYFGLRCLIAQGHTDQAQHALDLLLRSSPQGHSDWMIRLQQLRKQINLP